MKIEDSDILAMHRAAEDVDEQWSVEDFDAIHTARIRRIMVAAGLLRASKAVRDVSATIQEVTLVVEPEDSIEFAATCRLSPRAAEAFGWAGLCGVCGEPTRRYVTPSHPESDHLECCPTCAGREDAASHALGSQP